MELLVRLVNLVKGWFSHKYRYIILADEPNKIPKNMIVIISENGFEDTIIFRCPCGCNANIYLNLLADASPRWRYTINKANQISIHPSISRLVGCKSHFFIRNAKVDWA